MYTVPPCLYNSSLLFLFYSRQAGHRVGEHLERIMPMIVKYSKVENDDELREYCIQVRVDIFVSVT